MIVSLALAMLAAPGSAPARSPLAATVVAPKPPATATFVPTKPADPVADPKATVAQPAPATTVPDRPPERPPVGEGSPATANPTPPAGTAPEPKPAPTPPADSAPAPPAAQSPAPARAPAGELVGPQAAAPGFSTDVIEQPPAEPWPPREPEDGGSGSLWWLVLGGVVMAGAGAAVSKIRRRRLVERTHNVLSIEPNLDTGRIPPSMPDLALSAPPTSISTRLEAGAARTWPA